VKRLAALAAVGAIGTMGVAAPAGAAGLPGTPAAFAGLPYAFPKLPTAGLPGFPTAGLPAFPTGGLSFVGPSIGQIAAVIGPTVITTAPSTFINTNLQTSAGSALTGGQVGP
jgi:hypothetical protein